MRPTCDGQVNALDDPGPAGFVFAACSPADFLVLDFPMIGQQWVAETFWVTLSRQRPAAPWAVSPFSSRPRFHLGFSVRCRKWSGMQDNEYIANG